MKILIVLMTFLTINMVAQESIETDFYKIKIPKNTTASFFNSSIEEFAITNVYEFRQDNKPKYLLYLISNKLLDTHEPLNLDNCQSYLLDMEEVEVLSSKIVEKNKVKINFKYRDNPNITGVMFLHITNNILNRFLFLFPKLELYEIFSDEINSIFLDLQYVKEKW